MKMGVKEFRERFSEVADGTESVLVTKNGVTIGRYEPERHRIPKPQELEAWLVEMEARRDAWRLATPNWRELSLSVGIPADELDDPS